MKNYNKTKVSVILPSYNPSDKLISAVSGLIDEGFDDIIIIDDGSRTECQRYFKEAEMFPECTVVHHEKNCGKGRALKTGFSYFIENRSDRTGVVTADDDGQHTPADVMACSLEMEKSGEAVFGSRDFSLENIPPKSRFGNSVTSFVFRAFCGIRMNDTQTGLRAYPRSYLDTLCRVSGEHFEYETNTLLEMHREELYFKEIPITTIYIDNNSETHFHPLKDSVKIYAVILKFMLSSGLSSIIDVLAFTLINLCIPSDSDESLRIFTATFAARLISSSVNYHNNRKHVFRSRKNIKQTLLRYYILCAVQTTLSYLTVFLISAAFSAEQGLIQSVIKIAVDVTLFFISFRIQRDVVFGNINKRSK